MMTKTVPIIVLVA